MAENGTTRDGASSDESVDVRKQSTVRFPYNPISDAVTVARTISSNYGGSCDLAQLAGAFEQTTTSGTFRNKVIAAKMFGFVQGADTLSLTTLGRQVVVPESARAAMADAFLRVELFKKIFDEVAPSGGILPDKRAGLTAMIQRHGVVPKQAEKARQVFERSAKEAGYFDHGSGRLVRPAIVPAKAPTKVDEPEDKSGGGGGTVFDHPLMIGLLQSLPAPGKPFLKEDRERWLTAVRVNFDFIYGPVQAEIARAEPEPEKESDMPNGLAQVFKG